MLDAASEANRQVIIASHSPEIVSRVPAECLRWVDRNTSTAQGGFETGRIMEHLGVSADAFIPRANLPDILVYVEGVDDRPIIEALIRWCRSQSANVLPTTMVIPHRDGRFEGPTLQGIARVASEMKKGVRVVGIRDLDWYYSDLPATAPATHSGKGWELLTVPCKEMENLFCDSAVLHCVFENSIPMKRLQQIIDEESSNEELVDEWRYQVLHRLRGRLPNALDDSTKEKSADATFRAWTEDTDLRRRLVAGKSLLRRIRHRIRQEDGRSFYPIRVFEQLNDLPPSLRCIADCIFPAARQSEAVK
jgi:hypothetical protein